MEIVDEPALDHPQRDDGSERSTRQLQVLATALLVRPESMREQSFFVAFRPLHFVREKVSQKGALP
jgi:hypothetical protein